MRWEAFFMCLTGFGDETHSAGSQEIIASNHGEATRKAENIAKRKGWILDSVDAQEDPADLSGDPAHDTAAGGEPVPERGDQ